MSSYTERPFLKSMEKMTSEQITEGGCTMASMVRKLTWNTAGLKNVFVPEIGRSGKRLHA